VHGDPLSDPGVMGNVSMVIKDGRIAHRAGE